MDGKRTGTRLQRVAGQGAEEAARRRPGESTLFLAGQAGAHRNFSVETATYMWGSCQPPVGDDIDGERTPQHGIPVNWPTQGLKASLPTEARSISQLQV